LSDARDAANGGDVGVSKGPDKARGYRSVHRPVLFEPAAFVTAYHSGNGPGSKLMAPVSKEQRIVPRFGARLRELRGDRSLGDVAVKLQQAGLLKFGRSSLKRYEDGRVPDVAVLWSLSVLYRCAPSDLLRRLADELGVDVRKLVHQPIDDAEPTEVPDSEEGMWLSKLRALSPSGRKLAFRQVDALVDEFAIGARRPPSQVAKRRSVG